MPIESLQSRAPVTPLASSEGGATQLPAGTIEARVTAVLESGLTRFATAFGFVDLITSQPLSVGTRAQLLVENTGIRLLLTQTGTATGSTTASLATAVSQPPAATPPAASPPPAVDPVLAQLAAAARAATATQQSPTALLSRLMPLMTQAAGALPADVQRAAAQVLAMPLNADQPLDPAVLQAALRQSGLFREARGGAAVPDWKQALIALRSSLAAWTPQPADATDTAQPSAGTPAAPVPSDARAPAQAGATAQGAGSLAGPANGEPAATPASLAVPARPGVPGPVAPDATAPRPAAVPAGSGAMQPDEGALGQERPTSPALLGQLVARAFGVTLQPPAGRPAPAGATPEAADGEAGSVVPLPQRDRGLPPRADQPPRALPSETAPDQWLQADPLSHRDTLLALTDAALDRVRLSQFASLPREQPAAAQQQPPQPQTPAWVFDVPVFLGREAAVAQFRVTRDGKGPGTEGGPGARWSVDVAIDTSETGPVHARIRLGGGSLGVTLWAERPDMLERLRGEMPALRRTLDDAAFAVDEVAILPGSPQAPPARSSGYFLDTRS